MFSKFIKSSFKIFIIFLVLLISTIAAGLLIIYIKPRSLTQLESVLAYAINSDQSKHEVTLGSNEIKFGKNYILEISLKDLDIGQNNFPIFRAKNLHVDIDLINLFTLNKFVEKIKIDDPQIYLDRRFYKDREVIKNNNNSNNKKIDFIRLIKRVNLFLSTEIEINKGIFIIKSNIHDFSWKIVDFKSGKQNNSFFVKLDAVYDDKHTIFSFDFIKNKDNQIESEIKFENLPFFAISKPLEEMGIPLIEIFNYQQNSIFASGNSTLYLSKKGILEAAKINIEMLNGKQLIKKMNYNSLDIESLKIDLDINSSMKNIKLNNFEVNFADKGLIRSSALIRNEFDFTNFFKNNVSNFNLDYYIENINISDIKHLWSKYFDSQARSWVVENIQEGLIEFGAGKFNFDREFFENGKLKDHNIKAGLNISKTNLTYYGDYPKITNIAGKVNFSGIGLIAEINQANLGDSDLKNVTINLPYIFDYINIKGKIEGPVKDFSYFLDQDLLGKLKSKNIDLENISARSDSELELTIPLENNSEEGIKLEVKTQIKESILSEKLAKYPLNDISIIVKYNKDQFDLSGDAISQGALFSISYNYDFEKNIDKFICNGNLSQEIFHNLALEKYLLLTDDTKIPFVLESSGEKFFFQSNLSKSHVQLPKIGYQKEIDFPLMLNAELIFDDNKNLGITNISIKGKDTSVKGDVIYNFEDNEFKNINLEASKLAENKNIKINMYQQNNINIVNVKANIIDLSKAEFNNDINDKLNYNSKFKDIKFSADKILVKNGQILENTKLNAVCNNFFNCNSLQFDSMISGTSLISARQIKENNEIYLIIESDNGAAFLKAFDFYNNLKYGKLFIKAKRENYKDSENIERKQYVTSLKMESFALTERSFLSKLILNLTSIPTMFEMFSGNNIKISNFDGNLILKENRLDINGKMIGSSFNVTMKGYIDFQNDKLYIEGSLIPSLYGINQAVKMIPIVGNIITGGGDSAVAAKYTIKGTIQNNSTFVNPITLLPLSFFKNIFGQE